MSSHRFRKGAPSTAASRGKQNAPVQAPPNGFSPAEDDSTTEKRKRAAKELEQRAGAWRENNPDAWAFMVSFALHEVSKQRNFGMKWLIEEARRKDFVALDGSRTRICNTLSTPLIRALVKEHPEVRPFVVLKSSAMEVH